MSPSHSASSVAQGCESHQPSQAFPSAKNAIYCTQQYSPVLGFSPSLIWIGVHLAAILSLVWLEILTFPSQNMSPVVKIIQPSGILDGTKASQFRQEISDLVEAGADVVLIDFQDVTFMDSSGLGALVLALKTVRAAGSQLVVCSINEQIRILFELTSMDRVFEIFPTRDAFNSKILSTN